MNYREVFNQITCEIYTWPKHPLNRSLTRETPGFPQTWPHSQGRGRRKSLKVFSTTLIPKTFLWSSGKGVWEMCSQIAWLEGGLGIVLPSTQFLEKAVRTKKASLLVSILSA